MNLLPYVVPAIFGIGWLVCIVMAQEDRRLNTRLMGFGIILGAIAYLTAIYFILTQGK